MLWTVKAMKTEPNRFSACHLLDHHTNARENGQYTEMKGKLSASEVWTKAAMFQLVP